MKAHVCENFFVEAEVQLQMWCRCGAAIWRAGLCELCHRRERLSRERFGGERDRVLVRDDGMCVLCAAFEDVVVHHRARTRYITLCRGHHARVHHLRRLRYGMDPLFVELWREQHRRQASQLELALVVIPEAVQPPLPFEQAA